jgi:hypothetical protein
MKIFFLATIFTVLFTNCGISPNRKLFADKYLIYTAARKLEDSTFFSNYFAVNNSDTIIEVSSSFGARAHLIGRYPGDTTSWYVPSFSKCPYTVEHRKDGIYFVYIVDGKGHPIKRYPTNVSDTIKREMDDSFNVMNDWLRTSVYTGADTVIHFSGRKLKCKKYINEYYRLGGRYTDERYLEKETCLPIIINNFTVDYNENILNKTTFVLRFLLDKKEVVSNEFEYPNYFYPPDPHQFERDTSEQFEERDGKIFLKSDLILLDKFNINK